MTGNTVLLGLDLAQARGLAAPRSVVALTAFVAGAALGATIVEGKRERGLWPARVTVVCAIESAVLLIFAIGGAESAWRLAAILIPTAATTLAVVIAARRLHHKCRG